MTAMPTDWTPLAGSCPVPGDPDQIASLARTYQQIADEIHTQASNLRNLSTADFWESDAADSFRSKATPLAESVSRAYARYESAAETLQQWGPDLDGFQQSALTQLTKAQHAQAQITALQPQLDSVHSQQQAAKPDPSAPPPATPPTAAEIASQTQHDQALADQSASLSRQLSAAQGDLAAARTALSHIVEDYTSTAGRLAGTFHDVIENDGLHNTFWGGISGWIKDHAEMLEKIADILETIATWASNIAAVLEILAVLLPPPLDAVAAALATVANIVALTANCLKLVDDLMRASAGLIPWSQVAIDAGATALSAVGLKMGASAGSAVKAYSTAAKDAATDAAKTTGRTIAAGASDDVKTAAGNRMARGVDNIVAKSEARSGAKAMYNTAATAPGTAAKTLGKRLVLGGDTTEMAGGDTASKLAGAMDPSKSAALSTLRHTAVKAVVAEKGEDTVEKGYDKATHGGYDSWGGALTSTVVAVAPIPTPFL